MGKKKDCFGQEDYVCMTPNCPYARECIQVVWEKKMNRAIEKGNKSVPKKRRSPARITVSR